MGRIRFTDREIFCEMYFRFTMEDGRRLEENKRVYGFDQFLDILNAFYEGNFETIGDVHRSGVIRSGEWVGIRFGGEKKEESFLIEFTDLGANAHIFQDQDTSGDEGVYQDKLERIQAILAE